SSDSGISDLASNYVNTTGARPDVIYDALWNGLADTNDGNVPAGDWANHQRVHQFSGNINERHGGYKINIDQDYLDVQLGGGSGWAVQDLSMGPLGTAPRAVSTDSGDVYVFWRGVNPRQLWSARYTPARGWRGPTLLASGLGSQPSPAMSGAGKVNVFWKG